MRILILCDHYPISPRVKKMRESLKKLFPHSTIKVFAWNRENGKIKENYVVGYNQNLTYGNKIQKIINFIKFIFHAKKYTDIYSPNIIHAIDLEMLICGELINKKKSKLIYEVYDIKFFNNIYINRLREKIEGKVIEKYVKGIIFASPFFEEYFNNYSISGIKTITMNNKPAKIENKEHYKIRKISELDNKASANIVIGFIGTVRYEEILNNLIEAAKKNENIIILIAGSGPALNNIKTKIIDENLQHKVICVGRYEEKELESIYYHCDYIWAAYPSKDINVKYAISNKFFEANVFKKPIIVSEGTHLGNHVENREIGYTVNPYKVSQIDFLMKTILKTTIHINNDSLDGEQYWQDEEKRLLQIYRK